MEYTLWYDGSCGQKTLPVIYIHSFRGNGEDVWTACRDSGCPPIVLVSLNNEGNGLDDELSPWPSPGVWKGQAPYKGLAAGHLERLLGQCMPEVEARLSAHGTVPQYSVLAGYSLAGLFALWAGWRSGRFAKVATVSGSMWYPGFTDFIRDNAPASGLKEVYLSLGDKESHTRHPLMSQVDRCTEEVRTAISDRGIQTFFEWNRGNHFDHPELRMARALHHLTAKPE